VTTQGSPSSRPKRQYQRVVDGLRSDINAETYGPGDRLPTQEELAARFGVSRATVNLALSDLRAKGLIETRRGSGSFVKPDDEDAEAHSGVTGGIGDSGEVWAIAERVPPVLLRPYLEEAFREPDVTLDVLSMTTESLAARVSDLKNRIVDDEIPRPRSITARLILPDPRSDQLTIPRRADQADDPRVRDRFTRILQSHATMLRAALYELRSRRLVGHVDVQVRLMPSSPQIKLYILNRRLVLQGFYVPEEGMVALPPDSEDVAVLDTYGTGATLYPFRSRAVVDSAPQQPDIVRGAQEFFDCTWDKITTEADF
jgi:Transcriptional regulators